MQHTAYCVISDKLQFEATDVKVNVVNDIIALVLFALLKVDLDLN